MNRRELLALVALSGYVIAFVPVFWARYDVSRIPRSVWRYGGLHPRSAWRAALVFGYVCAGWPGLVVSLVWFLSRDRSALQEEWAHLHQRNIDARERRASPRRPALGPTAGPDDDPLGDRPNEAGADRDDESDIVLADYEEEPVPAPIEDASPPG
jgi:hypothetical protein